MTQSRSARSSTDSQRSAEDSFRRFANPHSRPSSSARLVAAALMLLSVAGCRRGDALPIKIDGSSTVYPITEAMAEEFRKTFMGRVVEQPVTVSVSGTGGGFKKFCSGETDISNASRPINPKEVDLCAQQGVEYIELPVAYDGLAVLVNPKNNWATSITTAELKSIWQPEAQGKVTKWTDVRTEWPERDLHLFGAGADSGTYDYFTEAIVGREHVSRLDYKASEDDNSLVDGIARDEEALGFFGLGYYEANRDKLRPLPIDDGKDDNGAGPVFPSAETVRKGTYQPLSRPLFIYVAKAAFEKLEVLAFVDFYLKNAASVVQAVKYIPLPDEAYVAAQRRASARRTGSVFGGLGSQVGVSIETLLLKERGN